MNLREWALPVYTVLIQMAIGMLLVLWILQQFGRRKYGHEVIERVVRDPLLIILTTIVFGMIGAHFHLSRPYLSFLAVRNFRTSWLSREIVFTLLLFFSVAVLWVLVWFHKGKRWIKSALGWLAISFGFVAVYCMGKIYLLPAQAAWDTPETILSYFGSMLLLGVMAMAAILIMDLRFAEVRQNENGIERAIVVKKVVTLLALSAGVILVPVIVMNVSHLNSLRTGTALARTSYELLLELYTPLLIARFLVLLVGVGTLVISVARMKPTIKPVQSLFTPVYLACLMVMIGEALGRFLFYAVHIRTGL